MKVFSIEKYCEDMGWAPSDFEQNDWQVKSNGKTEEEMYRMGYVTSESWMVEEPSALVFSEELYKKSVGSVYAPLTSDDWAYGLDGRSKEDIESNTYYKIEDEWCYVKTPVERFEVGKWYRFNGSKAGRSWNSRTMSVVLDNKPRLCTGVGVNVANFEGIETHTCSGWYWGDLSLWEEVPVEETKFERAQEQVDNIKENLEQLEYLLENKLDYASLVVAKHIRKRVQSVMDTLKVEV